MVARIVVPFCSDPITFLALVVPNTRYNSQVPVLIGTNIINHAKQNCPADKVPEIPSQWRNAFIAVQNRFVGFVKSTNKKDVKIQPLQTVIFSGLVRKEKEVETAVTENTETASSRVGVCPRIVALDKTGQNQRVPVRLFNMSAKAITIKPHTPLCQLQEVTVLRQADIGIDDAGDTAMMSTHTTDESGVALPDGVSLENTDLSEEEKERATHLFRKWESVFLKSLTDIGRTNLVEHRIKMSNEEPFKEPYLRIPLGLIEESENIFERC